MQLTLNSKPTMEGSRTVSYRPVTDETNLVYLDWITRNRRKVDEATGGRVGYIHVPIEAAGIREFIKWYCKSTEGLWTCARRRWQRVAHADRAARRKVLALNYAPLRRSVDIYDGISDRWCAA